MTAEPALSLPKGPAHQVESRGGATITTAYAGAIEVMITGTQRITQAYYLAGAQRVATRVITSTGSASISSNVVVVTHTVTPPLHSVGVTPTTVAGAMAVTLWATARLSSTAGAPTSWVRSSPPSGGQVTLTLTSGQGTAEGVWTGEWLVSGNHPTGDYFVHFEAEDQEGNRGDGEIGVNIRNKPIAPSITSSAGSSYSADPLVHLGGRVYNNGLTVWVYGDGITLTNKVLGEGGPWWTVDVTLTEGVHLLHAQAVDGFGQVSDPSDIVTVTVDTITPTVSVSTQRATHSGVITVTWNATDTGSGVENYDVYVADATVGGVFALWRDDVTQTSAEYQEGQYDHTYTFRVVAKDRARNTGSAEATAAGTAVRKYYAFGGKRIAMRAEGVVYYLHGDHLGSTSLVTTGAGAEVARQMYLPYGAPRWGSGTLPTDFTFTGQRADATGLMYYRARYYSSYLNRWIQPDTIVPQPGNPQDLNRYSYVRNNPLKYTDPTGHYVFEEEPNDPLVYHGSDLGTLARSWTPSSPNQVVQPAQRRSVLQRYASRLYREERAGNITSLEFLARLADYRASFGEPDSFVDDISRIILGGSGGWDTIAYAPTHRHHLELGDSGFGRHYQDDSNQVNHAWFAVHVGYTTGRVDVVEAYSNLHENPAIPGIGGRRVAAPWPGGERVIVPGGGASNLDHRLSMSGGRLGVSIRTGALDITRVGNWIRAYWGPQPASHGPMP